MKVKRISVLVVAERSGDNTLHPASIEALSLGRLIADELKGNLVATITGADVRVVAEELRHYGVDGVFVADNPDYTENLPETIVTALARIVEENRPKLVLMGETLLSLDIAPRLAFILNASLATDCSNIMVESGGLVFTKPIYSGNVVAEYTSNSEIALATLRSKAIIPAVRSEQGNAEIQFVDVDITREQLKTEILDVILEGDDGVCLDQAEIVVSGGRGIGSAEGFSLLTDLATVLGGVVGSSRPPVDSGWMPPSSQVGQTGKIIAPKLYIAVGISGAIQHMVGMMGSKVIIAINKAEDASIFDIAHYGVVGNYEQVIPALTERLKSMIK
jgi:electron transfer flavoprotein alpha subunit